MVAQPPVINSGENSLVDPLVLAALIAGIPATISAVAAIRNAGKITKATDQLTPSNGHTIAAMIEDMWLAIDDAADEREDMRKTDAEHDHRLRVLRNEVHQHFVEEKGVCSVCLSLIDSTDDVHGEPI